MNNWITCLTCSKITATKNNPAIEFSCGATYCKKCVKKYNIGESEDWTKQSAELLAEAHQILEHDKK